MTFFFFFCFSISMGGGPGPLGPPPLDTRLGVSRYPIRNPRWQPPTHRHTYITNTSRYQLAVLLNSINDTHDMMSNVIEHIGIISLLSFKATIKRYLNNKYSYFCSIINCFICKQYH